MARIPDQIPNESATAEWANAIRDQTLQRFDNETERTEEMLSPDPGDFSILLDSGRLQVYFNAQWEDIVPVGTILMLAGDLHPGYLACNGQEVSRATYPALNAYMAAAGYPWGNGNGSTTFNLPDLRQRFPLGLADSGTGSTLGETGGAIDHRHTGPSHTHASGTLQTSSAGSHSHGGSTGNSSVAHTHSLAGLVTESGGSHSHTFSDTFTTSQANAAVSQAASGTVLTAKSHTHTGSVSGTTSSHSGHTHALPANTGSTSSSTNHNHSISSDGSHTHTVSGSTASGGTGNTGTANPAYATVRYAIKFR